MYEPVGAGDLRHREKALEDILEEVTKAITLVWEKARSGELSGRKVQVTGGDEMTVEDTSSDIRLDAPRPCTSSDPCPACRRVQAAEKASRN